MQDNKGNQLEDTALSSDGLDQDLAKSDAESEALAAQLEMTVPLDIVSQAFRDSLLSKLIGIQAESMSD